MSNNVISHIGVVDSIAEGMVCVRIVQSSACSACKVASYCNSAESKEKIIEVRCSDADSYAVGQKVTVMADYSVGAKAVVIAFVIPIIAIFATIVLLLMAGTTEITAAIGGLCIMIPYYIILYVMRKRIEKVLTFYIKKQM